MTGTLQAGVYFYRSSYGTYIVDLDGRRVYESTNRVKAEGVAEYLRQPRTSVPCDCASH